MSEFQKSPASRVPHASSEALSSAVEALNIPYLHECQTDHPLSLLRQQMLSEHKPLYRWGGALSGNLNRSFGSVNNILVPEAKIVQNSFIIAYGLVRVGYKEAGLEIPGAHEPPEWYMWMTDESERTIKRLQSAAT